MEMAEIGAFFFGLYSNTPVIMVLSLILFLTVVTIEIIYTKRIISKKNHTPKKLPSTKNIKNAKTLTEIEQETVIDTYISDIFKYAVSLGYNPIIDWEEIEGVQHMNINNASTLNEDGTYDSFPITEMDLISLEIEKDSYEYKSMVEHMKEKLDECKRKNIGFSKIN
jgi:hypothetical protein